MNLFVNSHALYLKAPLVARRTLNKAIFAKLHADGRGSEPVVASDDLSEPFATIVDVQRAVVRVATTLAATCSEAKLIYRG